MAFYRIIIQPLVYRGILGLFLFTFQIAKAQNSSIEVPSLPHNYPWMEKELIQPLVLAESIRKNLPDPFLIFNIGVAENIKGAINLGASSELKNLEAFKKVLLKLPKNKAFVFYCGCCPFERCPNIRPAYTLVKAMGFTQAKLLNLKTNLKTNWINHGYPMEGAH